MNKDEFVTLLSKMSNCSKIDAEKSLNMVIKGVTEVMSRGENLRLVGFGSFAVQHRAARNGRNPRTGAPMRISAYNQPTFKSGKGLKDSCNK
ncbi:MAG: HU family DNA-binding protein [Rickettsiaceae bacterium]